MARKQTACQVSAASRRQDTSKHSTVPELRWGDVNRQDGAPDRSHGREGRAVETAGYSFRVRFIRSPRETLGIDSESLVLATPGEGTTVKLVVVGKEMPLRDSRDLALVGSGWPSQVEAAMAGEKYTTALMLAFARIRVGGDFGTRGPRMVITPAGLQYFARMMGVEMPVIQDIHGVMTYEGHPGLVRTDSPELLRTAASEHFGQMFRQLAEANVVLSDKERNALELYNSSFFYAGADSRFLLLMTAVEALLDPQPRPEDAAAHVDQLIAATHANLRLTPGDRASMVGSLQWLRDESIRQAGRRVVSARLGQRQYGRLVAKDFFCSCYDLRSRLVHGLAPFPSWEEVNMTNGPLELFVSDLLTAPYLES